MIEEKAFGKAILYTLSNDELAVSVSSRGATVTSIRYRGQETILGYESDEDYLRGTSYLGATVGRVGNRIGGAAFSLNGQRFDLVPNEGPNQLHGGQEAFDRQLWTAEALSESALRFSLFSPDGENGYPGNLQATVTYRIQGGTLRIEFGGESDRDTIYAPTNHMYFDLSGKGQALEAQLWLGADAYVEPGEGLIPTGRLLPTEGDFDFHSLRKVAREYDHAFVLTLPEPAPPGLPGSGPGAGVPAGQPQPARLPLHHAEGRRVLPPLGGVPLRGDLKKGHAAKCTVIARPVHKLVVAIRFLS